MFFTLRSCFKLSTTWEKKRDCYKPCERMLMHNKLVFEVFGLNREDCHYSETKLYNNKTELEESCFIKNFLQVKETKK